MSRKKESFMDLDSGSLRNKIVELKRQLFSLRFGKKSGELKDTSVFGKTKKTIARLFTILNRRGFEDGSK